MQLGRGEERRDKEGDNYRDGGDVIVVRNGLGGCEGDHNLILMRQHDASALCYFSRVNSSHDTYSNVVC